MSGKALTILLISPRGDFCCRSEEFAEYVRGSREMQSVLQSWMAIGSGLQTIAAVTPGEHVVTILDENREDVDFDAVCDVVGLTAMTQQVSRAYEIADEFRRRGRHVAVGGIHVTALPQEAASHADTVFIGEAEETWPIFIRDFLEGRAAKLYGGRHERAVELGSAPTPRYDLVAKYRYQNLFIQTTRGCPHDCEFCAASRVYGRRYRCKTVEQVLDEVRTVRSLWKTSMITFADDNMLVDRRRSEALLEAFSELNFSWGALTDLSVARDPALLRDLSACGCRFVLVGLESASGKGLPGLDAQGWKESMHVHYTEYVRRIQESGIGVYGSFIVGLDQDDPSMVESTVDFVNGNHLLGAQITILTPFPGSRLRERLAAAERIVSSDWKWYTAWNEVIRHPRFTPGELERCMMAIYQGIYTESSFRERAKYFRQIWANLGQPSSDRSSV